MNSMRLQITPRSPPEPFVEPARPVGEQEQLRFTEIARALNRSRHEFFAESSAACCWRDVETGEPWPNLLEARKLVVFDHADGADDLVHCSPAVRERNDGPWQPIADAACPRIR